ncbi:glycosyltransferase family 2 protein [Nocardia cyriacigeorgica]|uniref:glycosyltransferase family 2 protein n=1 Tax=Nocardia cyriacigeorgica TaxID=135487 RepID=UPI00245544F8|nr:glycosyltransferase family 2 protein [Nocardia cyriacigeorgica]
MLISVITPVHNGRLDYLTAAYESLIAQELPDGWSWEWLVQHDDPRDLELPAAAVSDPRVRPGSARHGGPGVARTVALQRARGLYVRNLDSDDVLPPTALADAISVLESHPEIGWTTCKVLDLLPDGSLTEFPGDPADGPIPLGAVADYWRAHEWRLHVHPTTITIRHDLLLAIGGWMALPISEDTGMMLTANAFSPGWFIHKVGLHYRQHAEQITKADPNAADRTERMEMIDRRLKAIDALLDQAKARRSQ